MAVDMFIKIGGIDGEAQDKAHTGQIDVLAWSWGLSQSGDVHTGGGGGSGKVSVQNLSITKYVDWSSVALIDNCCNGTHIKNATLYVRKAGGKPLEYIVIEIKEIIVASISTGGSGSEDRLTEHVTFNFAEFDFLYKEQATDGTEKRKKNFGFNIPANSAP
jgi:type VI secretion system secreted protein Hcp